MIKQRISKDKQKQLNYCERSRDRKYWTQEEDDILRSTVKVHGSNWRVIAEYLEDRNASQCAQRWKRVKPNTEEKNQKWNVQEDEEVKRLTLLYKSDWKKITQFLPNRTGRQVRERYINHLDPNINQKAWSQSEDLKIWKMYQKMGSKWSEMATKLKGRPENMIKNRFYGYIRKCYLNQENPYYIIPKKKRTLIKEEERSEEVAKAEAKIEECENFSQQNGEERIQRKLIHYQEFEQYQSDIHSSNQQIQSDRCIQLSIGEMKSYDQFQKMIFESPENDMKQEYQFSHFFPFEQHLLTGNIIHFTPSKQMGVDNYDNFINQFISVDSTAIPVKIRTDILQELTKTQQLDF